MLTLTKTSGVERARQIYQAGKKTQMQKMQQREAVNSDNSAKAPNTSLPGRVTARKHEKAEVALPAEWHTMQAKIESLCVCVYALKPYPGPLTDFFW